MAQAAPAKNGMDAKEGDRQKRQDARVDALLRGSTLQGRSSLHLNWDGVTVERRTAPPSFRDHETFHHHYILLWCGGPMVTEKEFRRGQFRRIVKRPGSLSLGAAGLLPSIRTQRPYDVVACILEPGAVNRVAEESDWNGPVILNDHLGTGDQGLASLIALSAQEADENGPHGRLYGDALAFAIMSRFLRLATRHGAAKIAGNPLPAERLRRVLDKIETEFEANLTLAQLARESGYSRAHFMRMFYAATGKTPHQYLLDVRLKRAHDLLVSSSASITAIALATGFSSHSHMTNQFRRWYGVSPSAVRANKTALI